jgi:hypothetical protein
MNFDFLELYKDHTNIQLLQILENPESYQPSAVNAARELLAYRVVTDADLAAVNPPVSETKVFEDESIADLVDRLTNPSSTTNKWVLPFILLTVAWFGYLVCTYMYQMFHMYMLFGLSFGLKTLILCFDAAYYTAFCILVFKKNRWGWLMLAARTVVVLTVNIGMAATYLSERGDHILYANDVFPPLLLNAFFVGLLWSAPISAAYRIQPKVKTGFLVIGLMLALRAIYIGYTTANMPI